MRSTIASSFLRITRRISRICPAPRQQQQTFMYSSLVSPPSSSLSKLSLSKLSQNLSKRHPFLQYRFASSHMTRADEKELECAKEFSKETIIGLNERDVQVSDFVKWSKVEIIKYYQEQIIIFEKEDPGEILQVDVYMSQLVGEDDKAKSWETKIPLFVTVKRDGLCLEFCCIASSDDITIDTVLMNGNTAIEGLEFSNFDQNLQRCFYEYLSTRGIKSSFKSSLMHFIKEYARIKRKRENIDMVTESELYP